MTLSNRERILTGISVLVMDYTDHGPTASARFAVIEGCLKSGELTIGDIVAKFEAELTDAFDYPGGPLTTPCAP